MGLSVAVRNTLLDYFFEVMYPTLYMALIDSAGDEVAAVEYARVETEMPSAVGDWSSADAGVVTNTVKIIFPTPSSDWGSIKYVKLYDALSGGTELGVSELPEVVSVTALNPAPEFDIGNVLVKII